MNDSLAVFFYGLFMDTALLAEKNVRPTATAIGYVDGLRLHIGERATLLPEPGARAYGVLMTITAAEASSLYDEPSVADYVAETVTVVLGDGQTQTASCYNLPAAKLAGTNPQYAEALAAVAATLGLPEFYREEIRRTGEAG